MLGFFLQFTLSSYMCVYEKIYLHMAILVFGILLYGIAEYRYLYRLPTSNEPLDLEEHIEEEFSSKL